jgi:hypothetical protein
VNSISDIEEHSDINIVVIPEQGNNMLGEKSNTKQKSWYMIVSHRYGT